MLFRSVAVENRITEPLNLGSGIPVSIREVTEIVVGCLKHKPEVVWDTAKPNGDQVRLFNIERAKSHGYQPQVSLESGIRETLAWHAAQVNSEVGLTGMYD